MGTITVTVADHERHEYWRVTFPVKTFEKSFDNGHAISIGLAVGQDITRPQLSRYYRVPITRVQWLHSGCQSACVLRGATTCRW